MHLTYVQRSGNKFYVRRSNIILQYAEECNIFKREYQLKIRIDSEQVYSLKTIFHLHAYSTAFLHMHNFIRFSIALWSFESKQPRELSFQSVIRD